VNSEEGQPQAQERAVVPAPVYQVIGEILAFTAQVDEALSPAEEDSDESVSP
jgi:hypothetical protein